MSGRKLAFVSAAVCEAVVDPGDVVNRMEEVFHWLAEGSIIAAKPSAMRINCDVPTFKSHTKAVVVTPLSVVGVRIVGYRVHPDGSGPSAPNSTRLVVLIDLQTGEPIALIDEHYNYTLRTAASVAVAAKHLAPENPRLGIVGAGGVAKAVLGIFAKVLPLDRVVIASRRPESRDSIVRRYRDKINVPLEATDSIEQVLASCNLIVTATTTKSALVSAHQIRPGMLLCALGSFELEPEIYRHADKLFVDDWSQIESAQDIASMIKTGLLSRDDLTSELSEVVTGRVEGRSSPAEVIIVRTEGLASQDIALSHWAFTEASRRGLLQYLIT